MLALYLPTYKLKVESFLNSELHCVILQANEQKYLVSVTESVFS